MEEVFKVAGVSFRDKEEIESILCEDPDFPETKKYLVENYYEGDRIFKYYEQSFSNVQFVPEPDNPADPNAIRVEVQGVHIGYIKSGRISRLRNVMAMPGATARCDFFGGPYKELVEDDDGKMQIEKDKYELSFKVIVTVPEEKAAEPTPEPVAELLKEEKKTEPKPPKEKKDRPKGLHNPTLVIILLILFWPVGMYGMWKNMPWSKTAKIIITIAIAILTILAI